MNIASDSRITASRVQKFNKKFSADIAMKYQKLHWDNCHHWDFTFLLWHRKFINKFWQEVDMERFYAILTERKDRDLYASLETTILYQSDFASRFRGPARAKFEYRGEKFVVTDDPNKLNSFTAGDARQIELELAQAMVSSEFAIDLDFDGANKSLHAYNLSFSSQLEEFHDIIHGETGLGMRDVVTAGGDQCFFVHHTFVDLVFETWLTDRTDKTIPITEANYNASPQLKQDYTDYKELESLFTSRYFHEGDYKFVKRIVDPLFLKRQILVFDSIKHTEAFRRVIMSHGGDEIGRFSILTGTVENCATCKSKGYHSGSFFMQKLAPLNEITWSINNRIYDTFEKAVKKFGEIGMSAPRIISF